LKFLSGAVLEVLDACPMPKTVDQWRYHEDVAHHVQERNREPLRPVEKRHEQADPYRRTKHGVIEEHLSHLSRLMSGA
jgi:hypothetical protein